jgi:hypothetical protein
MWKALVQRRYTETAGALGLSVVFMVIALAFVAQPERTIGQATHWTNRLSAAFLSLSSHGGIDDESRARQQASDQLFGLLVYDPWAVLNFGGVEHCVRSGTGSEDHDPTSVPVRPLAANPRRDARLSDELRTGTDVAADGKECVNNRNKYGPHFLPYAPGSHDRDAEYDALTHGDSGKLPASDPTVTAPGYRVGTIQQPAQASGYRLGPVDKPASDAMEKGGQYQRLLIAGLVFVSELAAFMLLGALSIAVILAQVLVLLLLAFAPVALVAAIYPGRGHELFRNWLTRLAGFLLRKAIYSLILAILLAVAAALQDASSNLGWLMSFGLQALFFWTVFLYRRQLTGQLTFAATGASTAPRDDALRRALSVYYAGRVLRRRSRRHNPTAPPPAPTAERDQPRGSPPPSPAAAAPAAAIPATEPPAALPPAQSRGPQRPGDPRPPAPDEAGETPPTHSPEATPHRAQPATPAEPPAATGTGPASPLLEELQAERQRLATKPQPEAGSSSPAIPPPRASAVDPRQPRDDRKRQ